MRERKIPLRKCIATQEMKPKKEMLRIVKNKEGEVSIDPTGKMNGRGAYLSISPESVQEVWDKKILDQVLGTTLPESFYEELLKDVKRQIARRNL